MSAVHYWDRHRTRMLPSRPVNAIGEIGLLLRATDEKLSGSTRRKLEKMQDYLAGPVLDEIASITGQRPAGRSGKFFAKWQKLGNRYFKF